MNIKKMGVINITPDSFSDGNKYNSFESFKSKFNEIKNWADIIDIGAESTAPFNVPISSLEEIKRFENTLFILLEEMEDPELIISIDTYKIEVFKKVANTIQKFWPKSQMIFNDVSGKIDEELLSFFQKTNLKFTYVFSHNLAPNRGETQKHMEYLIDKNDQYLIEEMIEYFKRGIEKLKGLNVELIIDPCFGFSKTREQNQFLIKNFNEFLETVPKEYPILYGISKKSFLRFPKDLNMEDKNNHMVLNHMQAILVNRLLSSNVQHEFIFRVHDPHAIDAVIHCQNNFH